MKCKLTSAKSFSAIHAEEAKPSAFKEINLHQFTMRCVRTTTQLVAAKVAVSMRNVVVPNIMPRKFINSLTCAGSIQMQVIATAKNDSAAARDRFIYQVCRQSRLYAFLPNHLTA